MDTTALADEPTVATNTPPTWSELIASRLADAIRFGTRTRSRLGSTEIEAPDFDATDLDTADLDAADVGTTSAGDTTGRSETPDAGTVEQGGRPHPESPDFDHWWLLVAPLAGAIALSAASVLLDHPLRTGASPSGLLAFAVLVPFFLLCVAGTLALFRDASRVHAAGAEWSPNPWHYAVPSAIALTAIRSYPVIRTAGRAEGLVGFLVGTFVVALATASILAGPAYLYRRRKKAARN
jgi:cbb3-type cytochrome oxidase subunit 3